MTIEYINIETGEIFEVEVPYSYFSPLVPEY